ncbi:hypothetical protein B0H10DRAFT_2161782 [Mycena sp. CBHHK59/15]|nr:hypothetical protein B0H10DRAFT_2161782 [Mycena sp. CBHHK59/15]
MSFLTSTQQHTQLRRHPFRLGYELWGSSFCSQETFRSAWFAYAKLQYLEGDMLCPKCGPSPENTIWDGVTLAFNRKHLLPSLEPPTISHPTNSIARTNTKYVPGQQLISDSASRCLILKVLIGPPLVAGLGLDGTGQVSSEAPGEEGEDNDEEDGEISTQLSCAEKASKKFRASVAERLDAIPLAVARLKGLQPALSRLFDTHFGLANFFNKKRGPEAYKRFFIQISAEESVLQMVTRNALEALDSFVQMPTQIHASALVDIPVLHEVLAYELANSGSTFIPDVLEVCHWILERSRTVLGWLSDGIDDLPRMNDEIEKSWMATGCCYGPRKIRERPTYPKLKHDVRADVGGKRGAKCSKFYSQYGEKRLTGGIIICYGFHCIPKGEGRNDVFSALITRWVKAPKRVIYDFACTLGPYCMIREPAFFARTQFLIDDFHASGHTKCSPAAFLKTYCAVDPRLGYINSSAGECGNSRISRVRKSVSYMSQDRAIIYTKVFLSIWNRQRIRSLNTIIQ